MKTDEDRAGPGVGNRGTILKGRVLIIVAGHDHAIPLTLQLNADHPRDNQNHVFFHDIADAAGTRVGSAMSGIQDYHVEAAFRRLRRRWRGCGSLRSCRRSLAWSLFRRRLRLRL